RGNLLEHSTADGLVEGGKELGLPKPRGAADDVELEVGPGGGRELEEIGRSRRQAGEALADDLANALRAAELVRRPPELDRVADKLDGSGLDERAPELPHAERLPVRHFP